MASGYDPKRSAPFRLLPPRQPRALVVHIIGETVGPPLTGEWCERCALPSSTVVRYRVRTPGGHVLGWGAVESCVECGALAEVGWDDPRLPPVGDDG